MAKKESDKTKESKTPKPSQKKRTLRKKNNVTVRERTKSTKAEKPKRIRKVTGKAKKPISKARSYGRKEYHLPLPDNKAGKFLRRRVRILPKFVFEAFSEIKKVTWPSGKQTIALTIAVFIFAIIFSSFVGILDYGLGLLFERFFVNNS